MKLLLTCEHGGNNIPPDYASFFEGRVDVLNTHKGYDIGALELFNALKEVADLDFYSETSRLLVDLNRSLNHNKLFSSITRALSDAEKREIIRDHYVPYRSRIEQLVEDFISAGQKVLHIAVHSFTPVLKGEERKADIGLLYDSRRKEEQAFCRNWKKALLVADEKMEVRFNYPYLGTADGFPTYLRRRFTDGGYIGIELEVNQKFKEQQEEQWQHVIAILKQTLASTVAPLRRDPL